ncbi:MAG: GGDEF domain-containing protein [Accumulibacter sp.]|jgi:diguanylate cyclase (GGDEF)-like protein|uniref:GGDEF domain-containing protein n=1 Tax=Accumulibacter sp. TaxID=2053492 RepID=UPI002FC2F941
MSKGKARTVATNWAELGGRMLAGRISPRLCQRLAECVAAMAALEKISSPVIPYIAAWREHEKIIWYEYVGARFLALLGCDRGKVDEVFRQSIVDRRLYRYAERESKVKEEIVTQAELRSDQAGLREEVKRAGAVEFVYQLALPGGKTIWLKDQANIEVFAEDQICLSIGCLTEVTKEMEQKDLLEKIGYFDELTNLPKRTILQRILDINIGNLRRGHINDFVFLLLDLDHFKVVNDTHGHQAGDQVLIGFAEVMRATKRHEDEIGRYGGEEFYGFSIGSLKNGIQFAERLRQAVANTDFIFNRERVPVTVSVGLVAASQLAGGGEISIEELVRVADRRLYVAKEEGRNRVVFQG